MRIRFYNIEWASETELPASLILDFEEDLDENELEMQGGELLEEEFGVGVTTFEWEKPDAEDEMTEKMEYLENISEE